jgi:hypothetical protein
MSKDDEAPAPFSVDYLPKENWGQKAFTPTPAQREQVLALSQSGMRQDRIALLVINPDTNKPIDPKTLREHFRDELDRGMAQGDALVLSSALKQAVGAPAEYVTDSTGAKHLVRDEIKPDKGMTIWQTKARPGIKWTERVEHTGKDGEPIKHSHGLDLTQCSDEELNFLEQLRRKHSTPADARGDRTGTPATTH